MFCFNWCRASISYFNSYFSPLVEILVSRIIVFYLISLRSLCGSTLLKLRIWSERLQQRLWNSLSLLLSPHVFGLTRPTQNRRSLRLLPKNGNCPSSYSSQGDFSVPGSAARFAIAKIGSCSSEYSSQGNYCVADSTARFAMLKGSSNCPSGCGSQGNCCVSSMQIRTISLSDFFS